VKHRGKESFIHLMEMVGWKANKESRMAYKYSKLNSGIQWYY
jgi:hypothetical protein